MQVLVIQSNTIFTSPLQSPHSKQLLKQQLLLPDNSIITKSSNQYLNPDYEQALDFANFIGLSPVNKIKRKQLSNVQRFFQANNFKSELHDGHSHRKTFSSNSMIKNDIDNRKLNFFDLKKIFQQRSHSMKLYKSKQIFTQQNSLLSSQIQLKNSRIMSVNTSRESSIHNNCFRPNQSDDIITQRLRIKTARQISRKQKQKVTKNQRNAHYIKMVQIQKVNRSKILKNISQDYTKNQDQYFIKMQNLVTNEKTPNQYNFINQSIQHKATKKLQIKKNFEIKSINLNRNQQGQIRLNPEQKNATATKIKKKNQSLDLRFKKKNNRFQFSFN